MPRASDLNVPVRRGAFSFNDILPSLVVAYESGHLTPFIGVGMSRPNCADWPSLIKRLEEVARIQELPPIDKETKSEDLIRRADRAVRKLRSGAANEFGDAFRKSLFSEIASVPEQTSALAEIWWPLVLSTNYDDYYVKAFASRFSAQEIAVVGRSSEDCQRVLTSLNIAGRALLWAIQGHLAAPCEVKGHEPDRRLTKELVTDHTEYRRVTHREPHFRRAFAEVFRHRSLFFLGSGLRETYLQELFGEVLELYGPGARTHFALMPENAVDPGFMYARFQIAVVEYRKSEGDHKEGDRKRGSHGEVPRRLAELREKIEKSEASQVSWSWGRASTNSDAGRESRADFEIVRGPLPTKYAEQECLVLSAGGRHGTNEFFVSKTLEPTLRSWCAFDAKVRLPAPEKSPCEFVAEYVGWHAFAVRARKADDTKDLLQVRSAALELFKIAAPRYKCLRMQLLASGGNDRGDVPGQPLYDVRVFPARFAFVEMVRAWGEWRRAQPSCDCRLALHLVDASVYREIQSGRIDVLELLLCQDVRFWAEIIEGESLVERRQFKRDEKNTRLGDLVEELGLSREHWEFEVSPLTGIAENTGRAALTAIHSDGCVHVERSLRELGVVPGSTLHFHRKDGSNVRATTIPFAAP
jgi:hypothetical protein